MERGRANSLMKRNGSIFSFDGGEKRNFRRFFYGPFENNSIMSSLLLDFPQRLSKYCFILDGDKLNRVFVNRKYGRSNAIQVYDFFITSSKKRLTFTQIYFCYSFNNTVHRHGYRCCSFFSCYLSNATRYRYPPSHRPIKYE